jgi:hypothetical protein
VFVSLHRAYQHKYLYQYGEQHERIHASQSSGNIVGIVHMQT